MLEPSVTDRSLATPGRFSSRRMQGALVLLLGLPILLVGMAVLPRFDGLYGQDPFAYYDYATGPLRSALLALQLPPPFTWPPGYPFLVALASFLVGPVPRAGQAVSLLAGALVPVFTALLAYEVWSREFPFLAPHSSLFFVPLLAGLLAALTGQLWQSSVVVMADTTGLAAATIGMWSVARYGRHDVTKPSSVGWLLLAAGAMAFATLTRWAYALVAIPAAAYALLALARRGRSTALMHGVAAGLVVLAAFAPLMIPILHSVLMPTAAGVPFSVDLQVYSWNPLNALRREFITSDGLLSYSMVNGLWYALAPAHQFYFTPLLAPLSIPGLWAVVRRKAAAPLFLVVGWAAAILIFHAGAPWQNFRFNLAHLPPLAILTAIGVATIVGWLAGRVQKGAVRHLILWVLAAYVFAGMLLMAHGGRALTRGFVLRKNADLATVAWVENQTPPSARLLTFNMTLTFQHESSLETIELYGVTPDDLADLLADGRPAYVLVDVSSIETQWQGQSPLVNYHWLRDQRGLLELGKNRSYTLFQVSR